MRVPFSPRKIDIDITSRCNLRCSYCYFFSSDGDTGVDLPLESWLQFFEECTRAAVLEVCLAGGEPLIRRDFRQVIEGVVRNRMRFSVLSNGTLLDNETAAFLKSTRRCNSFQVSIDGPGPESHDRCRGDGSFEKALRGLQAALRHGLPATVRLTIHRHNLDALDEAARLLLEEVGLHSFSTNVASYSGLCRQNSSEVELSVEEYSRAMVRLEALERKYPGRISAQAGPQASLHMWRKMEKALADGRESLPDCGFLRSCGGVFATMAVRSDGTMVPCTQLNHIALGEINRDPLMEIWQNHPELQRLRERRDMPLERFDHCRGCRYLRTCRGGCPAMAYNVIGDENRPSPDACYRDFLAAGGRLPA